MEVPDDTPAPNDFGEHPQEGGDDFGADAYDPTGGIICPQESPEDVEGTDLAAQYEALLAVQEAGEQPDTEALAPEAAMPPDPFKNPFTESQFLPVAERYNALVEKVPSYINKLGSAMTRFTKALDAEMASNPELAAKAGDAVDRMKQALGNVVTQSGPRRLTRLEIGEVILHEQGLTVQTGRPITELGVENFKQYSPSPEEADLTVDYLGEGIQKVIEAHSQHAREERYVVDGVEHVRQVLDLRHNMKEGSVYMQVSPDGLSVRFEPYDGQPSHARYHLNGASPDAEDTTISESRMVRRDTTDDSSCMDSLPDYGMAPSKEIWAERHVRRHAVRENLEAERLYGVNDNPICFAEAQFIRYLVEHGLPETPLINMLRLTNNRLRSSDDREPSSDNAYEAGLQFRHGMQGYFAQQDIVDDNAPIAFTFYVEAPQPLMGNRVEVGKECLIGESGTQVEPYVKIDAKRNLDPQEIARLQGLFRSANQSAKKIVGIEQLYVEHEAKYCINPSTNEMVTELTLQYVDQAGNVYLPRKRTVRADAMEAQTLVSFLRSNPNQVLTSVDT